VHTASWSASQLIELWKDTHIHGEHIHCIRFCCRSALAFFFHWLWVCFLVLAATATFLSGGCNPENRGSLWSFIEVVTKCGTIIGIQSAYLVVVSRRVLTSFVGKLPVTINCLMDVYYEDLKEHFAAHFRLGFLVFPIGKCCLLLFQWRMHSLICLEPIFLYHIWKQLA